MYEQAVIDHNISMARSYAIGDKIRDCAICESTPCRGYLVADSEKEAVIEAVKQGQYPRVVYAEDLKECAELITKKL